MQDTEVSIITRSEELPAIASRNFFHSKEFFLILEKTPGCSPYMCLCTDEHGIVQAHILAVVYRRGSWVPPYIYSHARIYGEMIFRNHAMQVGFFAQGKRKVPRGHRWHDIVGKQLRDGTHGGLRQYENRCLDIGFAQLDCFLDGGHAKTIGAIFKCNLGNSHSAMPICICTDHGHELAVHSNTLANDAEIMGNGSKIDFDPGASRHIGMRVRAANLAIVAIYALDLGPVARKHSLDMRVRTKIVNLVCAHESWFASMVKNAGPM